MSDQLARDRAVSVHDKTFLVEAGAGTGKTTLLIDRICSLVESGVPIEKIMAVTFTVKAAGQLKERLRLAFQEKQTSPHARRALLELDRMAVNTIHGLATDMLRTLPVEANLPPEFTLLDELQAQAAQSEFLTNWLRRALDEPVPLALDLAEDIGLKLLGDSKKSLEKLFTTLTGISDGLDRIDVGEGSNAVIEQMTQQVRSLAQQALSYAPYCKDPEDTLGKTIQRLDLWIGAMPANLYTREGIRWLSSHPLSGRKGNKAKWTSAEALNESRVIVEAISAAVAELMSLFSSRICAELIRWFAPAVREYRESLRTAARIGFDDLLLLCRDMLRRSKIARHYFKSRFSYLHIDEFQDTDPIQVEILYYLAEEDNDFAQDWQSLRLKPGKLFVVGDPKQAIYAFRGADVRVYNLVAASIEESGEKLSITRNFRSLQTIIDEVNGMFTPLMLGDADDAPRYEPLVATRREENALPAVELLLPHSDYEPIDQNADSAAKAEAQAIAAHIRALRDREELKKYGDAAILLRTGTKLEILLDALSARDIPFISFMNSAFAGRVEIEAVLTALAAIANPQHTVATIGVLRSPWFALSDDEIFAHKFSGGNFIYTEEQPKDTFVGTALRTLAEWHRQSKRLPVSELLELMLSERPVAIHFGMKSDGVQRVQNIATLVDLIRKLESGGLLTFQSIVDRLFDMEKLVQSTELEAIDQNRDAVQILTLHKAKGLEFPVVYIYRLNDDIRDRGEWLLRKSLTEAPHDLAVTLQGDWKTRNYTGILKAVQAAQKNEELRLQYVCMTRAKDRLIAPLGFLYGKDKKNESVGKAEKQTALSLYKRYYDEQTARFSAQDTLAVETTLDRGEQREHAPYRPRMASPTQVDEDSTALREWNNWQSLHVARLQNLVAEPRLSGEEPDPQPVDWNRIRALRVGTAVHAVLEQMAKGRTAANALAVARMQQNLDESEVEEVTELVNTVAKSELFTQQIPQARRIFTELPITESAVRTVQSRFIDLIFEDAHGAWTILDYKTDQVAEETLPRLVEEHYKPQLNGYAVLIERLTGKPPAHKLLYFIRRNQLIEL